MLWNKLMARFCQNLWAVLCEKGVTGIMHVLQVSSQISVCSQHRLTTNNTFCFSSVLHFGKGSPIFW